MRYFCIDLEMNQPSGKIIQIGYVIFNPMNSSVSLERCIDVRIDEEISPYITDLTGITQSQNSGGVSLQEALLILKKDLKDHEPRKHPLEWGSGDTRTLSEQSGEWLFKSPVNVKALYQTYALFSKKNIVSGLSQSMKNMGLSFEGRAHNALDDAKNTMRIFLEIGKRIKVAESVNKLVRSGE